MSGYHPFKSKEAKEKCLAMFGAMEKSSWPVKSDKLYIDTSYGKTFIRASGPEDAPPLVLLHGLGANSLYWSENIKELSDKFRTYAVDTVDDKGLSVCTVKMKDSSDHPKWLDELFTRLGLKDNISIMGHSYGGWFTGQYALRYQERLNKIVLIAPACTVLPIVFQFYLRQILTLLPFHYFKESFFSWVDPTEKSNPAYKKQIEILEECIKCYKPNYSIVRPTVMSDDELNSIKCPALFLVGEHEKIYSAEKAVARLDRKAPHISKEQIKGAGHMSILKSSRVNQKIISFLGDQS